MLRRPRPKRPVGNIAQIAANVSGRALTLWVEGVGVPQVIDLSQPSESLPYYLRVQGHVLGEPLGFYDVVTAYKTLRVSSAVLSRGASLRDETLWRCSYVVQFGGVPHMADYERVRTAVGMVLQYLNPQELERIRNLPIEQMPELVRRASSIDARLSGN